MATHNKITQEEINVICSGKYNSKELAIMLNRNKATITKIARQQNFKLPPIPHKRKYKLNEKVFETWNLESAYWLGFIYADGYITNTVRNGGMLCVSLKLADISILEKLKNFLQTDAPIMIYNVKNHKCCRLSICSRYLFESLQKIGLTKNKTYRLKFPKNIPKYLVNHFVRGYFDGDGCILIIKPALSKNENLLLQLTGQRLFLESVLDQYNIFTEQTNKFGSIIDSKIGCFSNLVFSGIKSSLPFAIWIYNENTENTRLERKYNKFLYFKNKYKHKLFCKRTNCKCSICLSI